VGLVGGFREAVAGITKEDYAFTVEVVDRAYDVYHFYYQGKPGTIAWRLVGGGLLTGENQAAEIIIMEAGHLDRETVERKIRSQIQ
jgi:hypothetical protein